MSILHFVSRGSPSKENSPPGVIDLTKTKRTATEANIGKVPDSKRGKPKTVSLATVKGWGYPFLGYKSEVIDGTEQVKSYTLRYQLRLIFTHFIHDFSASITETVVHKTDVFTKILSLRFGPDKL